MSTTTTFTKRLTKVGVAVACCASALAVASCSNSSSTTPSAPPTSSAASQSPTGPTAHYAIAANSSMITSGIKIPLSSGSIDSTGNVTKVTAPEATLEVVSDASDNVTGGKFVYQGKTYDLKSGSIAWTENAPAGSPVKRATFSTIQTILMQEPGSSFNWNLTFSISGVGS